MKNLKIANLNVTFFYKSLIATNMHDGDWNNVRVSHLLPLFRLIYVSSRLMQILGQWSLFFIPMLVIKESKASC
jgi:hypothetical protein